MEKDREYKDEFARKVSNFISVAFSRGDAKILGKKVYDDDGLRLTIQIFVATLIHDSRKSSRVFNPLSKLSDRLDAKIRIYPYNSMLCVEIIVPRKKTKIITKHSKIAPWSN